jgi:TolB-like protein
MPRELSRNGVRVTLQDQPLQILAELASHPHELVTRERLVALLWPRGVVDFDGSLNTAVRKLRAALEDDAETPRYIETLPRQGYRFIGQLDPPVPACPPPPTPPPSTASPRRPWIQASVAMAALVLAFFLTRYAMQDSPSKHADSQRSRIAVLPLQDLSPDPANAFFAEGLHEAILATLASRAPNVDVISRTTMVSFRGSTRSVPQIARELAVTHVLEGSVRRENRAVRLTVRLIDVGTDATLWSQTYDRELTSAMNLQSEVASEVALRLAVKLSPNSEQLPLSTDPDASDLYMKAHQEAQGFGGRASLENILEVEGWLDQAIEKDPLFAAAMLERARVRLRKFANSYELGAQNLEAVRADLDRARALVGEVPALVMIQSRYAQIVDWDMERAHRLMQSPPVVGSKDVSVLMDRAALLATERRPDDALALYHQASLIDPLNRGLTENWLAVLWNARRPGAALELLGARHDGASAHTAFTYSFTGRTEPLDEAVNPVNPDIDPGSRLMARVNRFRLRGKLDQAIALLEQTDLKTVRHDSFSPVTIPAIGRKPVAELHGWAMLLAGNPSAAKRDGASLLDFVAREPATKWNAWFLRVLAAEGELFSGNAPRAQAEIRQARTMIPAGVNVAVDRYLPTTTAQILAWAGAQDEAVELLEGLSREYPGVGPAEIVREPLFAVPLASNARFKELAQRLEAEITANQQLFDAASARPKGSD